MRSFLLVLFGISHLYASTEVPLSVETPLPAISEEMSSTYAQISKMEGPFTAAPQIAPTQKKDWIAVSLSSLMPGLGHVYLDDVKTAAALMNTTLLEVGVAFNPKIHNNSAKQFALHTLSATSFYGIYAAYRDTRIYNGLSQYRYQMPMDDLADLSFAPFKWSVMKKPEVWGGVLGTLVAATALMYFAYPHSEDASLSIHRASTSSQWPAIALPVGLGEEAFFRGYCQSALSENYGPLTGTILSSALFGAAHVGNADALPHQDRWRYYAFSLPLITAIGAYCGWMTHKNHSLQQSVAFHTWYDFILFSLDWLAGSEASVSHPMNFALAIPF